MIPIIYTIYYAMEVVFCKYGTQNILPLFYLK